MSASEPFTDEMRAWIRENAGGYTNARIMAEDFTARFGRELRAVNLRNWCRKYGVAAGWQGTRDRSPVHVTKAGMARVNGQQMTQTRAAWVLAGKGEIPKGHVVTSCVPGDLSPENLRLVSRGDWAVMNVNHLTWGDSETFDAALAMARLRRQRQRAVERLAKAQGTTPQAVKYRMKREKEEHER